MIEGANILTLHASVGAAERSLTNRIEKVVEREDLPLSVEDIAVLNAIVTVGLQQSTLIAEHLRKAPPTISHVISHLLRHGMVTRSQSDADKRVWLLSATDKGRNILEAITLTLETINAPTATLGAAERIAKRVR